MANGIVARTENIDKVVGDFQKDLDKFTTEMNVNLNNIPNDVEIFGKVYKFLGDGDFSISSTPGLISIKYLNAIIKSSNISDFLLIS